MPYDNTNSGALFQNDRKAKETHADYNGSINVDGKEFWLNGWKKTSKKGKSYLSLSIQPKKGVQQNTHSTQDTSSEEAPF